MGRIFIDKISHADGRHVNAFFDPHQKSDGTEYQMVLSNLYGAMFKGFPVIYKNPQAVTTSSINFSEEEPSFFPPLDESTFLPTLEDYNAVEDFFGSPVLQDVIENRMPDIFPNLCDENTTFDNAMQDVQTNLAEQKQQMKNDGYICEEDSKARHWRHRSYHFLPNDNQELDLFVSVHESDLDTDNPKHKTFVLYKPSGFKAERSNERHEPVAELSFGHNGQDHEEMRVWTKKGSINLNSTSSFESQESLPVLKMLMNDPRWHVLAQDMREGDLAAFKGKVDDMIGLGADEFYRQFHPERDKNPSSLEIPEEQAQEMLDKTPDDLFTENTQMLAAVNGKHLGNFFDDRLGPNKGNSHYDGSQNEAVLGHLVTQMVEMNAPWVKMKNGWLKVLEGSELVTSRDCEDGEKEYSVAPGGYLRLIKYTGYHKIYPTQS